MTFYPKGLFTLAGFAAVVLLGVYARSGQVDARWAVTGAVAYLIIEVLMNFGPFAVHRTGSK